MSQREIMNKVAFVVFGENSWRVRLEATEGGRWRLYFDAHGLSVQQARKVLKNIINACPCEIEIVLIHGYRHGTALKSMVREGEGHNGKGLSYRLQSVSSPWYNPGISSLRITAMRGCAAC